jgi:hypothetical protein
LNDGWEKKDSGELLQENKNVEEVDNKSSNDVINTNTEGSVESNKSTVALGWEVVDTTIENTNTIS